MGGDWFAGSESANCPIDGDRSGYGGGVTPPLWLASHWRRAGNGLKCSFDLCSEGSQGATLARRMAGAPCGPSNTAIVSVAHIADAGPPAARSQRVARSWRGAI